MERKWTERCGKEIKENNNNVWSVNLEEGCGQIVQREERVRGEGRI